jgi:hypothetical protein
LDKFIDLTANCTLAEIEIHPLCVLHVGQGSVALDVCMKIWPVS